nr:hypothetical protein [Tanacetum cinerariifolium]
MKGRCEDNFYVTAYYGNGSKVIGYDDLDIRNIRQRFMSCVWPLPDTEQVLGVEFLTDLPLNNMVRIKDTWDTIVQELDLEDGMIVVYTKKRANKIWLTAFYIDGTPATVVNFRGAIPLRPVQRQLSDHFEEDFETFYKPHAKIEARERLVIPADFLGIHPMHMYTKVLMRHNGYEQMMKVQMVYHYESPKRTTMSMSLEGGDCWLV